LVPFTCVWRLKPPASDQISECRVSDNSPFGFDLEVVRVPQQVVTAVFAFSSEASAISAATVIGNALRADRWLDAAP